MFSPRLQSLRSFSSLPRGCQPLQPFGQTLLLTLQLACAPFKWGPETELWTVRVWRFTTVQTCSYSLLPFSPPLPDSKDRLQLLGEH